MDLGCFQGLAVMNKASVNTNIQIFGWTCVIIWGEYMFRRESAALDGMYTFKKLPSCFSKLVAFSIAMYKSSSCSALSGFNSSHGSGCIHTSHCDFSLHPLVIGHTEILVCAYFPFLPLISSFGKYLLKYFPTSNIFLILSCRNSLCILNTSFLSGIFITNIFS